MEGEHSVVYGGETSGDRLVRLWVKGDDRINDDDVGAWWLMGFCSLYGVATRDTSFGCRFAWVEFASFQISKG